MTVLAVQEQVEQGDQLVSKHVSISPNEVADRLAIRELIQAYAHCADRGEANGQMALFTTDTHFVVYMNAKDRTPSQELHSRPALSPVFDDLKKYDATMHFVGQSTILTVAGSGVLGSQIAFQTAYKGFHVNVYDISDEVLGHAKERLTQLKENYKEDLRPMQQAVDEAFNRISFYADLAQAVADADLVIEAIPEVVKIKTDFYTQLGKVPPEKTVFVTNSSTLLPSQFAEATGRPTKLLALHFAAGLWKNNTAEVMRNQGTDRKVFEDVIEFAKRIALVALPLYKQQPGYILDSLLVFLEAAQQLLMNEVAHIETIDKTWMIGTGVAEGPFAILDAIGINSAFNIVLAKANATRNPEFANLANLLKTEYLDQGKLGRATGRSFYPYPNPSFASPNFLRN